MSNPVLNKVTQSSGQSQNPYAGFNQQPQPYSYPQSGYGAAPTPANPALASLAGLASKLGGLMLVTFIVAVLAVRTMPELDRTATLIALGGSGITAIICSILLVKNPKIGGPVAGLLAVAEGIMAGAITAVAVDMTSRYELVWMALAATAGTFAAMYVLFATGIIKATQKFRAVVGAAVLAIGIFYLFAFVMSIFGVEAPLIFSSSGFGIAFTVGVIIIAALTLVIDFDDARNIIGRAPKEYEWAVAGGLLVSLVWLYIEFLRLLMKLQSR